MAYIANTAFEVKISNHEFDSTANITGYFQNASSKGEICSAGFLCTRSALTDCEGYAGVGPTSATVTIKNSNTWDMVAATATTTAAAGVYACNPFDVNMVTDPVTGAVYKVGSNTLGLPAPTRRSSSITTPSIVSVLETFPAKLATKPCLPSTPGCSNPRPLRPPRQGCLTSSLYAPGRSRRARTTASRSTISVRVLPN